MMRNGLSNTIINTVILGCLISGVGPVWADGKTQAKPNTEAAVSASTIGEDPGPVYTQMVKQWAEATHFGKNAADVAVGKLIVDMKADPRLQKIVTPAFRADLTQFFYELFISPETMSEISKLYAQYFTLDEMQELINFYKTPLGQKLIKSNAEIMVKSQQIGAQLLKKHEKAYMQVIAKHIKPVQDELQKERQSKEPQKDTTVPAVMPPAPMAN